MVMVKVAGVGVLVPSGSFHDERRFVKRVAERIPSKNVLGCTVSISGPGKSTGQFK